LKQRQLSSGSQGPICPGVTALNFESDLDHPLESVRQKSGRTVIPPSHQSTFRSSSTPETPSQYFVIVLKGLSRDPVFGEDLEVEAVIFKGTSGVDYYKSFYTSHEEGPLIQRVWNILRRPLPTHGTYIRPSRLHSLQDKEIYNSRGRLDTNSKSTSLGAYKFKGKHSSRADDLQRDIGESGRDFDLNSTDSEQTALLTSGSAIVEERA
jgi:hypothetical protein